MGSSSPASRRAVSRVRSAYLMSLTPTTLLAHARGVNGGGRDRRPLGLQPLQRGHPNRSLSLRPARLALPGLLRPEHLRVYDGLHLVVGLWLLIDPELELRGLQ